MMKYDEWCAVVEQEKRHFFEVKQDLDKEGKELMKILDQWRFIKNTCIVLLHEIQLVESGGSPIHSIDGLINDLEEALEQLVKMEKEEYRFTFMIEKLIERGKELQQKLKSRK